MSAYLTPTRLARIIDVPILFPQTEVRRGKQIVAGEIVLALGQHLAIRSLTLNLARNLTPGALPVFLNNSLGLASVGVYLGPMVTSSCILVRGATPGVHALNSFGIARITTPGTYTVIVANNTSNLDFAIAVTGSFKLYA